MKGKFNYDYIIVIILLLEINSSRQIYAANNSSYRKFRFRFINIFMVKKENEEKL